MDRWSFLVGICAAQLEDQICTSVSCYLIIEIILLRHSNLALMENFYVNSYMVLR